MVRVLTVTTLYPSAARPTHGVFVENRMRRLAATGRADIRVIAPVPWFPFKDERFGEYAQFARTPLREERAGVDKTGDVLDSAQAGQIFEDLYVEAILHPDLLRSVLQGSSLIL